MRKMFLVIILVFSFVSMSIAADQSSGLFNEDLLKAFSYRELGPARQGGRILRIVAHKDQPYTFYVVTASGGLWKTKNNGTTFESLFDHQNTIAIGDMAVASSDPNILWVGTGTAASGRISLLGDGVYKSTDGGKTWQNMGLENTRHIGRIAIHPENPDIVYVAAVGFHFSATPDRGLYKTKDGGETWEKVMYISDWAGFVDVVIDESRPDIVYAAAYDKHRVPWQFDESGPNSGIYKSINAGMTWTRLANGLPEGSLGRIGIAVYPKNTNILYASVENGNKRPPTEAEIEQDRRRGREPQERSLGREVYRTDNGGASWQKMNSDKDVFGGGKWYGVIYIDPNDDQVIYLPATPLLRSLDGGRTWGKNRPVNIAPSVHVDHHAIWIDPQNSNHILLGNDGGLAASYDFGKTWDVYDNLPLAQYYAIGVDMEQPYNIYGGTQDCGSFRIPSNSIYGSITSDDWFSVGGGDGMYNQVDPEDSRWLYNEYQMGAAQRVDQKHGIRTSIRPRRPDGEPDYRFNWTTPIHISPHNSRIIYIGAEVLLRSMNRGDDWQEISPDLTTNDPEKLGGNIEHCSIITISESPLTPGIIWVGTDDGKVQLTKNGGGTWTDLTANLTEAGAPEDYYVSRIFASNFESGRAYVVKTGFQRDDLRPFIFRTDDQGATWDSISSDLPEGTVHVIVEDRNNPGLLFVGKEFGVFVTINGGKSWVSMKSNMPTNDVYDLVIHPRENDLVVGTHGRGLFVTDITPLQEINEELLQKDIHLFKPEPKIQWRYRSRFGIPGHRQFTVPNEPNVVTINYYLREKVMDKPKITIAYVSGEEIKTINGKASAGINRITWDMRREFTEKEKDDLPARAFRPRRKPLVKPGEYLVTLSIGETTLMQKIKVLPMPDQNQ